MFRLSDRVMLVGLMMIATVPVGRPAFAAGIHRGPSARESTSTPSPVVIGPSDRVRIETVSDADRVPELLRGKFVVSLVGLNHDNLTVVLEGGEPAVLHRDLVEKLQLGYEQGSRTKHALVGALAGGLVGALLGLSASSTSDSFVSEGEGAAIGATVFGAVGLLVGAVLPAGEHWRTVPIERVQWSPEPAAEVSTDQ